MTYYCMDNRYMYVSFCLYFFHKVCVSEFVCVCVWCVFVYECV